MDSTEILFTPTLTAPSLAREASTTALGDGSTAFLDKLALMVSELVTNCVKHGQLQEGDLIRLVFSVLPSRARIEVIQPGPPFDPAVHESNDEQLDGGLGLRIVDSLADRWGVSGPPCTVWFELGME